MIEVFGGKEKKMRKWREVNDYSLKKIINI